MAAFVDRVTVHVAAGNGAHGVSSVHREKFKPLGGPDGGNGGDGGDVVLEVDPNVHTLLDFHHRPHQKAGNGRPGEGSNRHGARGEDKVLHVPAGTVVSTPDGRVIADLVGAGTRVVLARGGKGLGLQFLRHVERCAVLVHVVDMATMEPGRDPETDIDALEHELAEYGGDELDLVGRLRSAVLNKIDVPDARELVDLVRASLEKRGLDVHPVSAATGEGLKEFGFALAAAVEEHRASLPPMEPARVTLTPKAVDDSGFTVERDPEDPEGFVVRGIRPERWVRQTDFTNDEAVGFLADRLNRLGVEEELVKAGAREGDAVTIGGVTFDWEPTLPAGTLTIEEAAGLGGRGTDARIDAPHRVRAQERLAAKKLRRTPFELSEPTWSDDDIPRE